MTGAVQDLAIDDAARAALARLTLNEKECLRRRLLHQTAKEMALDLGISPHAVEKRLKMARTKRACHLRSMQRACSPRPRGTNRRDPTRRTSIPIPSRTTSRPPDPQPSECLP